MSIRFDKYHVIQNKDGSVDHVQFFSGRYIYSYSHPVDMGRFMRKCKMKQTDFSRMAHSRDVWCKTVRRRI